MFRGGPHLSKKNVAEGHANGWPAAFWALLAATTLARLIYAIRLPLTGDEAYFWEWSRHPALSYYDHPPLAGWILTVTRAIFGDTVLAVRIVAVLSGAAVILAILALTRRITGSPRSAALTGILAMGVPLLAAGGVIYSTDTPTILAGVLGALFFHRAVEEESQAAWWGLGLCFATVSLSKFLGAALPAACLAYVVLFRRHRRQLAKPGIWIASAMGIIGFVPVIVWNAGHGWATFVFNFASRHSGLSLGLSHLADYLLGQAIAQGPVLLFVGAAVMVRSLVPSEYPGSEPARIPAFLALVPLGGFLVLSLTSKVGLHWPGIGVPALTVAAGAFLLAGNGRPRLFWTTTAASWAVTAAVFFLPLAAPLLPEDLNYPFRPEKISTSQLKKALQRPERIGQTVAASFELAGGEGAAFVFTKSYALSSLVAFYTPGHPETTVLGAGSAHGRNHHFWFEPKDHVGQNAVFVSYDPFTDEMDVLGDRFDRVEAVTDAGTALDGQGITVAVCYGFNGKR